MFDWIGCSAKHCPYDKEYADCTFCGYLIRKSDKSEKDNANNKQTKSSENI